jgi:uncharacterized protein (TIGR02145 family)
MTKNLDVSTFRNGDSIPQVQDMLQWREHCWDGKPAWCYLNENPRNGAKYGKLYNYYVVTDPRGLCPTGWHVPSVNEWSTLIEFLGGKNVAGSKLKSTNGWTKNGTNSSGFTALPGRSRFDTGKYLIFGEFESISWWSSGMTNLALGETSSIEFSDINVEWSDHKLYGSYVRCIKD